MKEEDGSERLDKEIWWNPSLPGHPCHDASNSISSNAMTSSDFRLRRLVGTPYPGTQKEVGRKLKSWSPVSG